MAALVVILALTTGAAAIADEELTARAEAHFSEGLRRRDAGERGAAAFRAAAADWEELRRRGVGNAAVYQNLGNAYLLAGDLPRAVLTYRMGLRQSPGDPRLRASLTAAREQVGGEREQPPGLVWHDTIPTGSLFTAAVLGYAGACVCLTRWWMIRRGRFLLLGLLLAVVAAAPAWLLLRRTWRGPSRPIVVVAGEKVLLRRGDGPQFPPWSEAPLPRGVEAELLFRRGAWLQVELAGGEVGWIAASDAVVEDGSP